MHVAAHSHFGTFDYPNDEKQAKLTILLSGVMALLSVVLILMAVYSPSA
jgi:hypothetical protein